MEIDGEPLSALTDDLLVEALQVIAATLAERSVPDGTDHPSSGEALKVAGQAAMDTCRSLVRTTDRIEAVIASRIQVIEASGRARAAGYKSVKTWLTYTFRAFGNAAGTRSRLAAELARLPETANAFANGKVSADQATAIAQTTSTLDGEKAATVEGMLLPIATAGAGPDELVRLGRMATFLIDPAGAIARARQLDDRRSLSVWWDRHGALCGRFRLPPETGARLLALLDKQAKPTGRDDKRTGRQRNADVLTDLLKENVSAEMVVWVAADTLAQPTSTLPALLRPSGMPLPAMEARALADSPTTTLRTLIVDHTGIPLSIGRRTRTWSRAQRRVIEVRDQTCAVEGCDVPAEHAEINHIVKWGDGQGGRTDVDEGNATCRWHNNDIEAHPERYQVTFTDGRPRYRLVAAA